MGKYEYQIEVIMTPHYHDNPNAPYFWRIASINTENPDSQWCTSTAGWAKTPEEAFAEAKRFYDKYKEGELK